MQAEALAAPLTRGEFPRLHELVLWLHQQLLLLMKSICTLSNIVPTTDSTSDLFACSAFYTKKGAKSEKRARLLLMCAFRSRNTITRAPPTDRAEMAARIARPNQSPVAAQMAPACATHGALS